MCSHSGVSLGDRERKHPPSDEPPASSGSSWLGEQGGGGWGSGAARHAQPIACSLCLYRMGEALGHVPGIEVASEEMRL